jgi:hypothetical protein
MINYRKEKFVIFPALKKFVKYSIIFSRINYLELIVIMINLVRKKPFVVVHGVEKIVMMFQEKFIPVL